MLTKRVEEQITMSELKSHPQMWCISMQNVKLQPKYFII